MDYNKLAIEYARHRRVQPEVFKALLAGSGISAASRVLEVGCGTANYLSAIQHAAGCQADGIDPSKEMLHQATLQPRFLSLKTGQAERLDFADRSFDLVFSVDVIHHVHDRVAFYKEAWRILAPGGKACTITDSEWIIRNRVPLSRYFPETVPAELARYPSIPDLTALMEQAGFIGILEEQVEFPYDLTDAAPFREKAFSSLHLLSPEAFEAGLARLEADLRKGPIPCISRYALLWGRIKK
jgi:ubiquinone/menaquinone biosynthesis C-methylase UbiE